MTAYMPDVTFYMHTVFNGGVERVQFNLAQQFLDRGLRVDLVLDRMSGSPMMTEVPKGMRVVILAANRVWQRPLALTRYLRRERPRSVLSAGHLANEVALVAKRLANIGTRVVVSEHTTLSIELSQNRGFLPGLLVKWAGRLAYIGAKNIISVSDGVGDDVARLLCVPRDRISTIYNGVISSDFSEIAAAPVNHPWLSLGEPPVIVGMGRLELQKDFPNLIDAFTLVRSRMPCRLMILGAGSLHKELQQKAQNSSVGEDILIPGFVDNPFAYLSKAAVFALSSAWEGLPTVLVEALALGTKVVSTDCPSGPREILRNGRYGKIVPVHDSRSLAGALYDTLNETATQIKPDCEWLNRFTSSYAMQRYIEALGIAGSR